MPVIPSMLVTISTLLTSGVLFALAILHVAWARGSHWPAESGSDLADLVIGRSPEEGALPGPGLTLVVASLLAAAAVLVLAAGGLVVLPLAARWVRIGASGVTCVLALRGVVGFFDRKMRPSTVGTAFARLNVRFYSPLCLALALGVALAIVGN